MVTKSYDLDRVGGFSASDINKRLSDGVAQMLLTATNILQDDLYEIVYNQIIQDNR